MEELLRYFIEQTNSRLGGMDKKLDDLMEAKIGMIVSARWVSLIVSSICGLLTMLVTVYVSVKFR